MPVYERRRVIWHMPAGAPRAPGLKTEPPRASIRDDRHAFHQRRQTEQR